MSLGDDLSRYERYLKGELTYDQLHEVKAPMKKKSPCWYPTPAMYGLWIGFAVMGAIRYAIEAGWTAKPVPTAHPVLYFWLEIAFLVLLCAGFVTGRVSK